MKGILFGTALIGSGGIVTGGYIFKDFFKKIFKEIFGRRAWVFFCESKN
ncbi:hypothetical protein [Mycoplasma suis]|nr:hypothetical protein [Mycoplasma suis]